DGHLGLDLGPVEGADQRLRQRQARGLDDDMVGPVGPVEQLAQRRHEIGGDGAADAAVGELDHVVGAAAVVAAAEQHLAIDAELAELVDDERDAPPARMAEQMADERGLARAEKAGDDRNGNAAHQTTGGRRSDSTASKAKVKPMPATAAPASRAGSAIFSFCQSARRPTAMPTAITACTAAKPTR